MSSNADEVLGWTGRLSSQNRSALARALTLTAKAAQEDMPAEMRNVLDRPNRFTTSGVYLQAARPDRLQAVVGIKDRQAEYLAFQIEGGTRQPKNVALRLPSVVQLNEFGNIPAGLIKQLIARAKAGRRATKSQARRFGVSQSVDLFYGDPGDGRPAGIYKRVVLSATQHRLVPIIVFPKQSARYQRRFDFYGVSQRIVQREFVPTLVRERDRAFASSR